MKYIFLLSILVLLSACTPESNIENFIECVEAGNPVMESYPRKCTSDGVTYIEEIDEQIDEPIEAELHICTEEENAAEICTMDYSPVCGFIDNGVRCITAPCPSTDAMTYSNGCTACSAGAIQYYRGACEDQEFVVCSGTPKTGFDPESFAEDIGGVCVGLCPGNYDGYVTQIGVEMCILNFGEEEIGAWESCDRSTESCECVKAYETTRGETIEDPEYRCVPEQYAERLLFRAGLDRLDEQGEQSVMIA